MKKNSMLVAVFLVLMIILAACTWPFGSAPIPVVEGTPNATLTALFDTSKNIPATITPAAMATNLPELPTVEAFTATATASETPTSTIAPTSTNTLAPTATLAPATAAPSYRGNAQLAARYLSKVPVQDGTYAEWVDYTNKYTTPYFIWGKANWVNHADQEGAFAVAWDNTNLYIGVKVTDDVYTQNNTGDQIYVGDAVEILIDTDLLGDFYTTTLSADDYQLGLSAGNPATGVASNAYLWFPSNVKGTRSQVALSYLFESSTVYRIEAAIPWSMLGVTPYSGLRLGFAVNIDDNDNVSTYDKVTMLSSASGLAVVNPTTWGELLLTQ